MKLDRNQLAQEPEFQNLEDISVVNLEFRPIIDQTGTFTYNHAAKVISDYLRPYVKNNIPLIINTQTFLNIPSITPLQEVEEDISYDFESLFPNILIEETIN